MTIKTDKALSQEGRSAFIILTGKPRGKKLLRRPRHRWEHNIRIDLKEIGVNVRNWIVTAQDRNHWRAIVNAVLNLWLTYTIELV